MVFVRYDPRESEILIECPYCDGDAYNGDPENGTLFRGGAKCSQCGKTFSAIGRTPKSKEGPVLQEPTRLSEESDRSEVESASPFLDSLIEQGATAGIVIADEVRAKVLAAIAKKKFPPRT